MKRHLKLFLLYFAQYAKVRLAYKADFFIAFFSSMTWTRFLPAEASLANPVDMLGSAVGTSYEQALGHLLRDLVDFVQHGKIDF